MTLPRFPESLPEFQRVFPDEGSCAAYLEGVRWPGGFVRHYCGVVGEPYRFENRAVLRCRSCKRDTSLTAGSRDRPTNSSTAASGYTRTAQKETNDAT